MADTINEISRLYVADNVRAYDNRPEGEAVLALTADLRHHVESQGWDAADFQVDLEEIARDGLNRHRNGQ